MRLGLLTAPFPETPLDEVIELDSRRTASRASRSPAGRGPPARADATPGPATSTSPPPGAVGHGISTVSLHSSVTVRWWSACKNVLLADHSQIVLPALSLRARSYSCPR